MPSLLQDYSKSRRKIEREKIIGGPGIHLLQHAKAYPLDPYPRRAACQTRTIECKGGSKSKNASRNTYLFLSYRTGKGTRNIACIATTLPWWKDALHFLVRLSTLVHIGGIYLFSVLIELSISCANDEIGAQNPTDQQVTLLLTCLILKQTYIPLSQKHILTVLPHLDYHLTVRAYKGLLGSIWIYG